MRKHSLVKAISCGLIAAILATVHAADLGSANSALPKDRACYRKCLYKFLDEPPNPPPLETGEGIGAWRVRASALSPSPVPTGEG